MYVFRSVLTDGGGLGLSNWSTCNLIIYWISYLCFYSEKILWYDFFFASVECLVRPPFLVTTVMNVDVGNYWSSGYITSKTGYDPILVPLEKGLKDDKSSLLTPLCMVYSMLLFIDPMLMLLFLKPIFKDAILDVGTLFRSSYTLLMFRDFSICGKTF